MNRTWTGETLSWESVKGDKLTKYWKTCGEHYRFEIHPSVMGWKLYIGNGDQALRMIATNTEMKTLREIAETRNASL